MRAENLFQVSGRAAARRDLRGRRDSSSRMFAVLGRLRPAISYQQLAFSNWLLVCPVSEVRIDLKAGVILSAAKDPRVLDSQRDADSSASPQNDIRKPLGFTH
jgi:hypothetical protein